MPIPHWIAACLTISAVQIGHPSLPSCIHQRAQDQQLNMRLIARFVVLMVTVFGVSLAFAWAWDKSDKPQDTTARADS
jgi:multisubunit Na+/H+ antiporter MnhB subunit